MGTLYISEFRDVATVGTHRPPIPPTPSIVEQNVTITSSSMTSSAFNSQTRMVMVNCDAACSLAWGQSPTATTSQHRLAANETRFYGVLAGEVVAVISNT